MRKLKDGTPVSMKSFREVWEWLNLEAIRATRRTDLHRLDGGRVTPSYLLNWAVIWLASQPEDVRDRIYHQGWRVLEDMAARDEPLDRIPSVPLDQDPPIVPLGRPRVEVEPVRDHEPPHKRRAPKRR